MENAKRDLSYDDLLGTFASPIMLQSMADRDMLSDKTFARIRHVGRFFTRVGQAAGPETKVSDIMTERDLLKIWKETADPGDTEMPTRPLLDGHLGVSAPK